MKNFFNAIGVASMEKIHSAMIAWILDDKNDKNIVKEQSEESLFATFPKEVRSEILCKMFGIEYKREFESIQTHVEWNDIDIMIETIDKNNREIWVIENKLKTPEHKSNSDKKRIWQTEKYVKLIQKEFKGLNHHYMLLSLGGDEAKYKTEEVSWNSFSYSDLYKLLNEKYKDKEEIVEYRQIKEYIYSIERMIKELENFKKDPSSYSIVFEPKKKKEKKAKLLLEEHLNENVKKAYYILENGLETIFQKEFLKKIVDDAQLKTLKEGMVIDEDNGTAEFDYTIARFDKEANVADNGNLLFQIQFQNGAFKVVIIHQNYRNNKPEHFEDIYGNKDILDGKWYKIFVSGDKEGWDLHKAQNIEKNDNPKPRISFTKNIGTDWYTDINKFKEGFKEAVEFAKSILDSNYIEGDKNHIKSVLSKLSMT
jgi:hypothetical protein